MADQNYNKAIKDAEKQIDVLIAKVNELDSEILQLNKNAASQKGLADSFAKANASLSKHTEQLSKLVAVSNKVSNTTNKLTKTRKQYNYLIELGNQKERARRQEIKLNAQATSKYVGAYQNLIAKQKQAKIVLRDLLAAEKQNVNQIKIAQAEYNKLTARVQKANQATRMFSKGGLRGAVRGLKNFAAAFGLVGAAFIAADIVKTTFNLIKRIQSLNFALETITKTTRDYARATQFISTISNKFGADILNVTERYTKFLAAAQQSGVALEDTEKIFGTVTKASGVLGLRTDELTGVYLALEQMMSKGKVTTEELRRQLGERLPGAFGIMADAVGVSVRELDQMLKKGQIMSAEVLPKFAEELERAYGIETVKKIETVVAAQERMENAFVGIVQTLTEGSFSNVVISVLDSIANAVNYLGEALDYLGPYLQDLGEAFDYAKRMTKAFLLEIDPSGRLLTALGNIMKALAYGPFLLMGRAIMGIADAFITVVATAQETYRVLSELNWNTPIENFKTLTGAFERIAGAGAKARKGLEDFQGAMDDKRMIEDYQKELKKAASLMQIVAKGNGKSIDSFDAMAYVMSLSREGLIQYTDELLKMIAAQKSSIDDEDGAGGLNPKEGSIAFYEELLKKMEEERDKLATNSTEYRIRTQAINEARVALELLIASFENSKVAVSLPSPEDAEKAAEEVYKIIEDQENERLKKGKEIADALEAYEDKKRKTKAEKEKNAADQRIAIFRTVTDAFSEYYDIDMEKFEFLFDQKKNTTEQWADASREAISGVLNASLRRYEIELAEATRSRDLILNNDLATEEQKRLARERFERKEAEIRTRRAKAERRNALIQIAVDTAAAVVKATAQTGILAPAFIPLMIGIGAAQAAIVASQPIPKFAEGHLAGTYEGAALINDAKRSNYKEVVERKKGGIEVYGDRNQVIDMKKGDKVHKSIDSFMSNYKTDDIFMMNMMSDGMQLSRSQAIEASLLTMEINKMGGKFDKAVGEIKNIARRPIRVNNRVVVSEPKTKYE